MRKLKGKSIAVIIICIMLLCTGNVNVIAEDQSDNNTNVFADLAFPTAEGNGKYISSFRGGRVIRVTNLNDSGEGSLRWALEEVSGPRIVVFAVGGVIELKSCIEIDEEHGSVYIAGQTAPGDGITVTKYGLNLNHCKDIVIRNLRIRAGVIGAAISCVYGYRLDNCIIDHCSVSWASMSVIDMYDYSNNFTVQNSIIAEPLVDAADVPEALRYTQAMGTGISTETGSFYNNVITNCITDGMAIFNATNKNVEVKNNLFFNVSKEFYLDVSEGIDNNISLKAKESADDIIEPLDEASKKILSNAGAVVPKLDDIDKRYISEIDNREATYVGSQTGMKGFLDSPDDAEGCPDESTFKGGEAPLDSDEDGMPDEWELSHGLNPNNYYDACQVYLSDEGYTNIELYINELMGDPVKYSENPVVRYEPEIIIPTEKPTEVPTEIPTVIPTEIPTENPVLMGDVNYDGNIDAIDALMVLKHAAKIEILSEEVIGIADVIKDDVVNSEDALKILKIAARISD